MSGKQAKRARRNKDTAGPQGIVPPIPGGMIKRKDITAIWNVLEKLADQKGNDVRFAYGISKNRSAIKAEIDAIAAMEKPSEDYAAYEQERVEMCKVYSKRNPDTGEPLTYDEGRRFAIDPAQQKEFDEATKKLMKKHKAAIDENIERMKKVDEFLDIEMPAPLWHPMALDLFPADITARELEVLDAIIKPPRDDEPTRGARRR